jgi:hypothetical protein
LSFVRDFEQRRVDRDDDNDDDDNLDGCIRAVVDVDDDDDIVVAMDIPVSRIDFLFLLWYIDRSDIVVINRMDIPLIEMYRTMVMVIVQFVLFVTHAIMMVVTDSLLLFLLLLCWYGIVNRGSSGGILSWYDYCTPLFWVECIPPPVFCVMSYE